MASKEPFINPFRPSAGINPPYLAGREHERDEFASLLNQRPILKNLVVTGLRGIGKTVLLNSFQPLALESGWLWSQNDLNETTSISEINLIKRILADLSVKSSNFTIHEDRVKTIGFMPSTEIRPVTITYDLLITVFERTPGLNSDKLKNVFDFFWNHIKDKVNGVVMAYDEAQNLSDNSEKEQFPLSLLLEVSQYLQRREIPFLFVLTGLPSLYPTLVETRTYSERMFHVLTLKKLSPDSSREAIRIPIEKQNCPVSFSENGISEIVNYSGGYPYFIQFICKEAYDSYLQQVQLGLEPVVVAVSEIVKKLDTDFYSPRWSRLTEGQRDFLKFIASLPNSNSSFTSQDITSKTKSFGTPGNVSQRLKQLIEKGLLYKENHGVYSFAVPMLADFINRQTR